jgi:hypothetical protein
MLQEEWDEKTLSWKACKQKWKRHWEKDEKCRPIESRMFHIE